MFNLFGLSYLAKGSLLQPALSVVVIVIVDLRTTSSETATQTRGGRCGSDVWKINQNSVILSNVHPRFWYRVLQQRHSALVFR